MKDYSLFDLSRGLCLLMFNCTWGYSSVGRAPALQAGGQEFDSPYLHHECHKDIHHF